MATQDASGRIRFKSFSKKREALFPFDRCPIGSSLHCYHGSIVAQSIEDGRGRGPREKRSPVFWHEIGGDEGWVSFGSFGDDLEKEIAVFFGMTGIAEFIDGEDVKRAAVVFDPGGHVLVSFDFRDQIEGRDEVSGVSFLDGVIAKCFGDMGLAEARVADEDEIGTVVDPGGVSEGKDIFFWETGIEVPLELVKGSELMRTDA